jgi:transcriptional regulator with XRE-family HTH domain
MSTTESDQSAATARPNAVALACRQAAGWSQRRQAREFQAVADELKVTVPRSLDTIIKQISRVERGITQIPEAPYLRVWCRTFNKDAAELFGHLDAPVSDDAQTTFAVTSHKFMPAYLGCDTARALLPRCTRAEGQWRECHHAELPHPTGTADLYVWPFGVAVVHLREELHLPSLAHLAVWRARSYPTSRAWADSQLRTLTGTAAATRYALSAYWLKRSMWAGDQLDVAMRLLSMPSVLLDRDDTVDDPTLLAGAELVERSLLTDHSVDRPDLVGFGARGVSIGYASWSGVAYHPVAPRRALAVTELVTCELLVQAIWCYTHEILRQVETGADPVVPAEYSSRFLRAVRSRLTAPRELETGQHNSMRDAVLSTSGLIKLLDSAMDALRDTGDGTRQ